MTKITRRKALYTGLAAGAAIAIAGGASALPLREGPNAKVQIVGGQSPGVLYKVTITFSEWAHYSNTRNCSGRINVLPEWTRNTSAYGPITGIAQEGLEYILLAHQRDGVTPYTFRLMHINNIADCITKAPVLLRVDITPW